MENHMANYLKYIVSCTCTVRTEYTHADTVWSSSHHHITRNRMFILCASTFSLFIDLFIYYSFNVYLSDLEHQIKLFSHLLKEKKSENISVKKGYLVSDIFLSARMFFFRFSLLCLPVRTFFGFWWDGERRREGGRSGELFRSIGFSLLFWSFR